MPFRAPRAVPALDGLRFIGLCVVVFTHLPRIDGFGAYNVLWRLNQTTKLGYLLLDSFFALSGFLITRLLLAEKAAFGRISFKRFYARRGLRILPIYYLTLLACMLCFPMTPGDIATLATHTFNIRHPIVPVPNPMEHTWSLSVEEQFYLVWPLLISLLPMPLGALVTGRLIPALALLSAVVISAATPLSENVMAGNLVYMLPVTRIASLSLGAWLAFREFESRPVADRFLAPMFVAALALLIADRIARDRGLIASQGFYGTLYLVGYALMSASIVGALVFSRSRIVRRVGAALSWSPMRACGRATYGAYLYHLPILVALGLNDAVAKGADMPPARVALAIALVIAATAISYRFIEGPLLARKTRIARVAPEDATPVAVSPI